MLNTSSIILLVGSPLGHIICADTTSWLQLMLSCKGSYGGSLKSNQNVACYSHETSATSASIEMAFQAK